MSNKTAAEILNKHLTYLVSYDSAKLILDAMEEYATQSSGTREVFEWVKASERLPEEDGRYAVRHNRPEKLNEEYFINMAFYSNGQFYNGYDPIKKCYCIPVNTVISWLSPISSTTISVGYSEDETEKRCVEFAVWLELEGYRIRRMDYIQRHRIYFMFKNGLGG